MARCLTHVANLSLSFLLPQTTVHTVPWPASSVSSCPSAHLPWTVWAVEAAWRLAAAAMEGNPWLRAAVGKQEVGTALVD